MDAYQVLGLPKGSSKAKVKTAYRRLANKYHPDKNPTPEAEALFKLVKEAYEFLTEGTSSTGSFTEPSRPEPRPKRAYHPPQPTHPVRVEVWLTFSEAFTGCRAKIRGSHFGGVLFCDVMPGTNHGEIQRLMATDSYGRSFWVDAEFHVHDPKGFYTLNKFNGENCLYCRVHVSLAEALSEKELELPNINPHASPVRLTIPPSAFTDGDAVKVLGTGLLNRRSGKRGPLYVQPLFYNRELAEESYPTLVKLKGRIDELLKAYKYFK